MTTLRDLSRHLGLSVTQVSRALNDHADVAADTRERVRAAARELGYQPNVSARRLATGRSGMLGLVLPDIPPQAEDAMFVQIVGTLSQHLSRLGRAFVLHIADPQDDIVEVYRRLTGGGALDGFVLLDPERRDRRVEFLRGAGVPFVIHGRIEEPHDYSFYDIDNRIVAERLTEVLVAAGHRRIAFLNGPRGRTYAASRHKGWRAVLARAGIAEAPGLHRWGPMSEGEGLLAGVALFGEGGPRPTGVVCGNARLAAGLLQALRALGLRVPGDVSVVAHDDELPGFRVGAFDPPLTATWSPLAWGWPHLARLLAAAVDGAPLAELQMVGEVRLVERGSVAPVSAATRRRDSLTDRTGGVT
ncbi:LacI family DNA-binding transcriptional regulator [Rubellimicrobium aerolatum]|uniref:LacI family DNA-binding transcriptional regulator n=1 Tax=Rubellimicrobium aerolatum TaxID=490979 RepID=A0ABW0SFS7_9RHOB|nr:LacI family DNA-binding transcriptional regulator [Rubellimicrobium aerolatum]MBP1807299.1 LacI family transcriptional regulator [Rubellimicrobium aerolatum]